MPNGWSTAASADCTLWGAALGGGAYVARSAIGQDSASDLIYAAVRNAEAEAERIARLTDDLLLLARSDEDRLSLRLERTYVGSLLRRNAELAGSRLAAAGVTGRVEVRPGTCVRVDVDRIRQAVGNALRFAPGCSVIVLAGGGAGRVSPSASCRTRSSASLACIAADRAVTEGSAWTWPSSTPTPTRRPRRRSWRGAPAEEWLAAAALSARLTGHDGQVRCLGGWPAGARAAVPVPPGSHVYPATRPPGGGR